MLRVMLVDDSRIFRSITEESLKEINDVKVVASVWSGDKAISFLKENDVDLITLDVEMPGMDGLETLFQIQRYADESGKQIGVIMLSGLTHHGADITMSALEQGAFDFIPKPDSTVVNPTSFLKNELQEKIESWRTRSINSAHQIHKTKNGCTSVAKLESMGKRVDLVCIGVSTGGPKALHNMLPELCKVITCPICIVQHMPVGFTESLASGLNKKCSAYTVLEGVDGTVLWDKHVYIAPGGAHMVVRKVKDTLQIGIHSQPPENGCRPSVDVLFRSVAQVAGEKSVVAMILTGMGNDGAAGIRPLKRNGAFVITQDEESCVVYGMPKVAQETGLVDVETALMKIPQTIHSLQKKELL